jgi:hypothetical protein
MNGLEWRLASAVPFAGAFLAVMTCAAWMSGGDESAPGPTSTRHIERPATEASRPTILEFQHFERYEFGHDTSAPFDIRWDGEDALLILRSQTGLFRHRLTAGLPLDRWVLPGAVQLERTALSLMAFGRSSELTLASSHSTALVYTANSFADPFARGYAVESLGGAIADLDVYGSKIAVLGMPSAELHEAGEHVDSSVWIGRYEDRRFGAFETLLTETGQSGDQADGMYLHNGSGTGALRFSTDGSLLVALGYRDEIVRFGPGGGANARWRLAELLGARNDALETFLETRRGRFDHGTYGRWVDHAQWLVDDVFFIGKSPALVVREKRDGKTRWLLGIITGDQAAWYRIPFLGVDSRARVRADALGDRRIAFLAGGRLWNLFDEASERTAVIVADAPE